MGFYSFFNLISVAHNNICQLPIIMRFVKKINNLFNSNPKQPKEEAPRKRQPTQPRVISFGETESIKSAVEQQEEIQMDEADTRFNKLQEFQSLRNYNLRNDEIEAGEVPVFLQSKLIFLKSDTQKYDDVTVLVTNYKLCLKRQHENFFFIYLGKIQKLQRYTENQTVYKMLIQCKDGRKFKLRISSQACWRQFYERMEMFSFVRKQNQFFAYRHFQEGGKGLEQEYGGWNLYHPLIEFKRMGINIISGNEQNSTEIEADFKTLDNREGKICSTYPPILIVPARLSNDSIIRCSKFRSRERLPALTYAYQYEKGKFSCIYRSSQSKVGVKNSRSTDDQMMLRYIGNPNFNFKDEKEGKNCTIYDARNYYAALGNRIAGKGYQSEDFYPNCKVEFLNIPNIHAVRDSYNKMLEACFVEESKFMNVVAESKWYEFIFLILAGSLDLAKNLLKGTNSLVHCSDGWDRTSQLCSLGAILLDPYYRTLEGLLVLIEKDWIHFGHQFRKRLAQGINDPGSEDKSQVFLQFLDCITQLIYQFPNEFQFEYKLIDQIADQAYGHLYGNFLCNNYNQMHKFGIMNKTVCLWSKILKHKQTYINPYYNPEQQTLTNFDPHQRNFRIWKQFFLQFQDDEKDVYKIYSFKYTYQNMETMYKNITKEVVLLQERAHEYQQMLDELDLQIRHYSGQQLEELKKQTEELNQVVSQKQNEGQMIGEEVNKMEEKEEEQLIEKKQKIEEEMQEKVNKELELEEEEKEQAILFNAQQVV